MSRSAAMLLAVTLAIIAVSQEVAPITAQNISPIEKAQDAREQLIIARTQQRNARLRAERLESESARAQQAAAKARGETAALAARVQQTEAEVAVAEAELAMVERQRRELSRTLGKRREPLMQLTAALQTMARRPLILAALQPGSLRDVVHTRAILDSAMPVIEQRTAYLRGELDRARTLENERGSVLDQRRVAETSLKTQKRAMAALAQQERIRAVQAAGGVNREARLASQLAEEARDLDALVGRLEQSANLRQRLASLEGPVIRPARPGSAALPTQREAARGESKRGGLRDYVLPVAGRITAGFGEATAAGERRKGITLLPRAQAQVVAPASGRVAFAGKYEGYGRIVILEHESGWTSLITGLGSIAVVTGQDLSAGSPIGLAPSNRPEITLELRRDGTPLNPLEYLR